MQTILFGLSTAISWAVADIFIAHSTKTIKPVLAAAWVNFIGSVIFCIYYLLFISKPVSTVAMDGLWLSALAGFFITVASAFFFIALHRGPIGIVSALSSTYPAVTLILAISMFEATINLRQGIGFAMVLTGVVAAAGFHSTPKVGAPFTVGHGTLPALLAALCWGIGYALLAQGVKLLGWQLATLVQFIVIAACCLLYIVIMMQRSVISITAFKATVLNPFTFGAAITQQGGAILLNIGLSGDITGGSIIVALSACYPVLTAIMAYFIFKERVPLLALAGGLLAIIGIITLSL